MVPTEITAGARKVDMRLPTQGNSNSRTSRLSIKNSASYRRGGVAERLCEGARGHARCHRHPLSPPHLGRG